MTIPAKVPATLLSFVYHTTVPAYRDEMHANFDHTFERFKMMAPGLRQACREVALAAFKLRNSDLTGQPELAAASAEVFSALAPSLAHEVASGISAPDQKDSTGGAGSTDLLTSLYLLVYSSAFRATNPPSPTTNVAAWNAIKATLNAGSGDFAVLQPHATTLCNELNSQFDLGQWRIWW